MILIALGANLPSRYGTPPETLAAAIRALEVLGIGVTASSRIWLTAPVPISDQPWYHNAVIAAETSLPPLALLKALQSVEGNFGRIREVRNEPRVIDLDLLAYNDEKLDLQELTLPHPRLHERGFVLLPLQDIAPDWRHPVTNATLKEMIAILPPEQFARPHEAAA